MRHRKAGLKLNRTSSHRNAMFRNMVTSLFKHDRIRTTDAKAKELRRWADKMVTLAKRGDLHARRQALSIMMEKNVVHKLFEEASDRFGSINGGYTRLVKLGTRPGDAASVTLVELVSLEKKQKKKAKKKTKTEEVKKTPEPETEQEPVDAKEPESTSAKDPEPEETKSVEAKPEETKPATEEKTQQKTAPKADEKDTDVTEKDTSDEKESAAEEGADKQEK